MRYYFVIFLLFFYYLEFLNCKLKGYLIICPELCGACFLRDLKNADSNHTNINPLVVGISLCFIPEKKIMCLCFFERIKVYCRLQLYNFVICIHVLLFMTKMNWKGLLKLNLIIWYFSFQGYFYCVHRRKKGCDQLLIGLTS